MTARWDNELGVRRDAVEAMNEAGKFTHAFLARGAKTIPSDDD
jgi:hypothetical protein